ncbi:hypothetical protein WN51_14401 [Melipona quadrifasciata]|uniref:Uncharacterized protein n=1 Tax=Melipona quadrifasciata TaxID=166423 RepID=A0A0M8ZXX2_9HYME|nr:hypothetical protein WN51_14401 [Melipona quadrifasciata]
MTKLGLMFLTRIREERPSRMVLTVTEDTPADMLAGSMELLVQLPRDHHLQTQKVTVQRSFCGINEIYEMWSEVQGLISWDATQNDME